MTARGFAVGSAMFAVRDIPRHDPHTEHTLDGFRARLHDATDPVVLSAAAAVERAPQDHPLTPELRDIVDAELSRRHLSLAVLAVTR